MNKQQAIELLQAMNAIEGFVPPIMFRAMAQTQAMQFIVAMANSVMESTDAKPDNAKPPAKG